MSHENETFDMATSLVSNRTGNRGVNGGQHQNQRRQKKSQQEHYSFSLTTDEFNQIMMSNIGSVVPSRNSIVGFMNNPGGLLDVGSMSTVFDRGSPLSMQSYNQGLSPEHSASSAIIRDLFDAPKIPESNFKQGPSGGLPTSSPSKTLSLDQCLSSENAYNPFQQVLPEVQQPPEVLRSPDPQTKHQQLPNRQQRIYDPLVPFSSSSSSTYSRSDAFTIPDPFSASIDDDLFSEVPPVSLPTTDRNKRKEPAPSVTPSSSGRTSPRITPISSLLHQACYLYPTTLAVVNSALGVDATNLRKRVPTPATSRPTATTTNNSNSSLVSNKRPKRQESFTLPLHIAVDRDGSLDVVQKLVDLAPDVIAKTDGPDGCNVISAHLYKKYHNPHIIQALVQANPEALKVVDRFQNTCLHVACAQGAPLGIVKLIHSKYPQATEKENFHGQSPLDVAQRTSLCSLQVIDFLQEMVLDPLEYNAAHLDSERDDLV